MRVLFVGQIIPEKGVHTIVEAVAQILKERAGSVQLTIVGGSSKPTYLEQIRQTIEAKKLEKFIRCVGQKKRSELPEIYAAHDLLVLASIWDEAFAITPLEAMACGLAVVATTTGGSSEIFRDQVNSVTFFAGDAEGCAAAITKLLDDVELYDRIRRQGMADVAEKYTLERMVDKIEADLRRVCKI